MQKLINRFSTFILIYFLVGGLSYLGGKGVLGKGLVTIFTYPLELMYRGSNEIILKGPRAFQTDRIVTKVNTRNKLKQPLFILHTNPESTSIDLIDLKSSERISLIDISKDIHLNNVNDRPMLTLDTNNRIIYCNLNKSPHLYKYDYDGGLLDQFSFNFEIHHRSEVFDGRFFCNTRRSIILSGLQNPIKDEGFAEIDVNGNVLNIFWLSEQKSFLNKLQAAISFTSWAGDPFHLNDVELVYNSSNNSDTNKLMNGDVLLSARHLNSIILVRNNQIYKIFQGSFNLQHDVDIINDSIISITNNNSAGSYVDLMPVRSNVIHYNIVTQNETTLLNDVQFATKTEGQVQYLPSGRIVLENQNSHELIVVNNDTVIFRGGINYSLDTNYSEYLSWAPAFDYNPFDKQN